MNDNNPYAAPKAAVADLDPQASLERPIQVVRAVRLFWMTIAIGFAMGTHQIFRASLPGLSQSGRLMIFAGTWTLVLALYYWLLRATYNGKNFGRITLLVFFLLNVLSTVVGFQGQMAKGVLVNVLAVFQVALNMAGLYLLFTPASNEWYRAMKRHRTGTF
jgi:hypothetical protein